ncbi:MAG TPA: glycosyltransferase family protein [Candidatus Nitrosotalea sp.]|nr:glycosyltransferase family protein [Candidatus Nitrosotalea sp.]
MKNKPKIVAIIQARMHSSRFPGKIMKKINGDTVIDYVIRQTLASKYVGKIIIVTTRSHFDDKLVNYCEKKKIEIFRGKTNDVLDRYYKCAKKYDCDPILRISSDCPFIDPNIIDKIIEEFFHGNFDYVSNNFEGKNNSLCNYPQGMVVEIASRKALEKAWKNAKKPSEREHVFPYIQFHSELFNNKAIKNKENLSFIRCTVDYLEDLEFLKEIIKRLPKNTKIITIKDIKQIVNKNPEIVRINNWIDFEEGYKKSLKLDNKS